MKWRDAEDLILRIQQVGQRLVEAQPREMVVGNIVRRVLGLIRDEILEEQIEDGSDGSITPSRKESVTGPRPGTGDSAGRARLPQDHPARPLMASHTSYAVVNGVPAVQSMFNLLSATPSEDQTPTEVPSPKGKGIDAAALSRRITTSTRDMKSEICDGINEIIDELLQSDERIAGYAHEHIHSNEIILTHTSSRTVQQFLLKAAAKRKFTVIVAESYPNDHEQTHSSVMGAPVQLDDDEDDMGAEHFHKSLTAAGLTVVLITDASIFALMSRVNKVILATHAVIANGGLVAASGARIIAKAAHKHRTPVIVVSGVYKLSPQYPYEFDSLIEYGDPDRIITFDGGDLVEKMEVENPLFDYVPPDLVDLYITNL
jgi:translation initiation factor eIF-2B subunit beta